MAGCHPAGTHTGGVFETRVIVMKTEKEIRAHRDNLLDCLKKPCKCAAEGHAFECTEGGLMMRANAILLSWVLGENEGMDALVEAIDASVKRWKAGMR